MLKTKVEADNFLQNLIRIEKPKNRRIRDNIENPARETVILRRVHVTYLLSCMQRWVYVYKWNN